MFWLKLAREFYYWNGDVISVIPTSRATTSGIIGLPNMAMERGLIWRVIHG